MKKIVLMIALVGGIMTAQTTFAQEECKGQHKHKEDRKNMTPTERATKHTERMKKELNLTDVQVEKVQALNVKHFEKMELLHKEAEELRTERKTLRDEHKAQVENVLTPEQQALAKQKMEERKQKRQEHKRDHKVSPPLPPVE